MHWRLLSSLFAVSEYNGADKPSSVSVVDELDSDRVWYHTSLDAATQEEANCFATLGPVVERPVIYVHADESVGVATLETSCKLHCMIKCVRPMRQPIG